MTIENKQYAILTCNRCKHIKDLCKTNKDIEGWQTIRTINVTLSDSYNTFATTKELCPSCYGEFLKFMNGKTN